MKGRPSNVLLTVIIGIVLLLACYVLGGLLIKARREVGEDPEALSRRQNPIAYSNSPSFYV